jgi:hypothetical protein
VSHFTGVSGDALHWVLLLVYVGPWGTHFTGYCCWLMWGLGETHLAGYWWFMWHLGQHTLLGIVVGLCGVLLLVMLRLGQHTLLAIVVGL